MATSPSVSENCIYKTVTLASGEQFNLPPGAILVGASDITGITSTCPIPTLEQSLCYAIIYSLNDPNTPSPNLEYSDNNTSVSINILGTEYLVAQSALPSDALFNAILVSAGLTGVITNTDSNYNITGGRYEFTYTFKTIPSIASTMNIHIQGPGYGDSDPNYGLFVYPQVVPC